MTSTWKSSFAREFLSIWATASENMGEMGEFFRILKNVVCGV